jgi:Iap family predicted aminopeptidase
MRRRSPACPAPSPRGVTGEVVYVGFGTAVEFDAAGDVRGKIVLVDFHGDAFWSNMPSHEATIRGARAVILTTSTADLSFFSDPDSLGSNDGEHDLAWVPLVYVSRTNGDWLRGELARGPVTATVKLDATITRPFEGGVGYNVVGELPGSVCNGEKILVTGHHDAFFRSALDSTTAVVAELVTAKAMKLSGYVPRRTVVFTSHTGEEGGIVDSWYDWTFGSWVQVTQTHPEWPGTVSGLLNMEMPGAPDGQIRLFTSPELLPAVSQVVAANQKLKGPGLPTRLCPVVGTNSDEWLFTAAGVPSVLLVGAPDSWFPWYYHTTNDTVDKVDWAFFGTCVKLLHRVGRKLDEPLVPYSLAARAD